MAPAVWALSVNLETKTAVFQSGLADAARAARGAFTDIKSGASDMSGSVGGSMGRSRQAVMLLGDEFGIHLPRGLTTFIASLGPVGAAMTEAFPFIAIAMGATLLLQHLAKLQQEGQQLTQDQAKFGTAVQQAFNSLDEKLLQAGIRADELRNDHMGALKKQLELIDKQSMAELVHQFDIVGKAADVVFGELKTSWYQFGNGSEKAKQTLDEFQSQYASLLAQGKDRDASDLLANTLLSSQRILDLQKEAQAQANKHSDRSSHSYASSEDDAKQFEVINNLKREGRDFTADEVKSQQTLVEALQAQVGIEQRMASLKAAEGANAKTVVAKEGASQAAEAARQAAEATMRVNMQALQSDRAIANARLTIQQASIQQRMQSDIGFADAQLRIELQGNAALMAALDKGSKDYNNQLKAAREKAVEIIQQHQTQVAEITSRATTEQNAKDLRDLEEAMRESINATQQGTAARINAIQAAIRVENALGLQGNAFYRDLLTQRAEATRQEAEEENKLRAEAGAEAASQEMKMGMLMIAAQKQLDATLNSSRHTSDQQRMQQELAIANQEYQLKLKANAQDIAALDKTGKDYNNKLKALQDQQKQLVQEHENEITAIKDKAEQERNRRILAADTTFTDDIARNATQVLMGHKSFAAEMTSIGNEVVTGMMQNALKSILTDDMTKEHDAAAAARKAFNIGMSIGGPAGVVLGPVLAAAAFTAVMAFSGGTDRVPGVGPGDTVPAMLEPGEGVVPGGVMDGLSKMARSGNLGGGGTHYHLHTSVTLNASALDSDGMDTVLKNHGDKLEKHFANAVRKMNRG